MRVLLINDETRQLYDATELTLRARKRWSQHFGFEITEEETILALMEIHSCNRYVMISFREEVIEPWQNVSGNI